MACECIITRAQTSKIAKGHGKTKDTPALSRGLNNGVVHHQGSNAFRLYRAPYFGKGSSRIRFSGVVSVSVIIAWVTLSCTTVYRTTFVMTTIGSSYCTLRRFNWKHTRDVELISGFLLSVLHHAFRSSPPFGLVP